ncbi:glycosyltransferase family A protein [Flavobacterium sp. H122]|uniref:glycosyltransferase family 2 protein n=1 Tax=Flavobacterium sp. H122 TaxID=2529860 RepID=UPI0010AA34A4|nr:glycosyltransferase family A protein [Flavobacterium sp. H122]
MPIFSVIIPLYNKEKFIEATLKSVLAQTYIDFEIIIVNDGSTDYSIQKVNQIKDSRIKIYHQENKGAASARNQGIEKAVGELIAFLDADDIWFDNHLEELYKLYIDFPECSLFASRYNILLSKEKTYIPEYKKIKNTYRGVVFNYFVSSEYYPVATSSSIAIKKDIFDKIGYFKTYISSGQDTDMWIRIALKYKIAIGNKITATYLQYIPNTLSKTHISFKTIKKFEEYQEFESQNVHLKKYLDKYRKEYALHYKIAGDSKISTELYSQIDPKNISTKFKILYFLPKLVLIYLLNLKRYLNRKGLEFTIYN